MSTVISKFQEQREELLAGYIHEYEKQTAKQFVPAAIYQIVAQFFWSYANFIVVFEGNTTESSFLQFVSIDTANPSASKNTTETIPQKHCVFTRCRRDAYCLVNNNHLCRAGGEGFIANKNIAYNIASDEVQSLLPMKTYRTAHRLLYSSAHQSFYAVGGHRGGTRQYLTDVEFCRYDPDGLTALSTWKTIPKCMSEGRANFGACMYAEKEGTDSHIFVSGGWNIEMYSALTSAEIYSFETQNWIQIADMKQKRTAHGMAMWKNRDRRVVAVGSWDDSKQSAEEYDFHKNAWYELPKMNGYHRYFPAISFCNDSDSVMVVCGDKGLISDDWGANTNLDWGIAEMYDARDSVNKWIRIDHMLNLLGFATKSTKDLMYRAVVSVAPY